MKPERLGLRTGQNVPVAKKRKQFPWRQTCCGGLCWIFLSLRFLNSFFQFLILCFWNGTNLFFSFLNRSYQEVVLCGKKKRNKKTMIDNRKSHVWFERVYKDNFTFQIILEKGAALNSHLLSWRSQKRSNKKLEQFKKCQNQEDIWSLPNSRMTIDLSQSQRQSLGESIQCLHSWPSFWWNLFHEPSRWRIQCCNHKYHVSSRHTFGHWLKQK